MSEAARDAVILEHTKSLRLPTVGREFPTVSRQARDAGWPYEDHLKELLEREVLARQTRTVERLIKYANFPDLKTLDQIDWKALKGISKPKILELATCGYIEEGDDVIFAGPIGTGKSHLAIGLGIEAARRRHRVVFTRAADLVRNCRGPAKLNSSSTLRRLRPLNRLSYLRYVNLRALVGGYGLGDARISLPKGWPERVRSAVLHAISMAHFSLTFTRI